MRTYPQAAQLCPVCGYGHDRASTFSNGKRGPEEGDFSICLSCGTVCRYDKKLQLQSAPQEDIDLLTPKQQHMIRMSQHFIRQRGPLPQTKQ